MADSFMPSGGVSAARDQAEGLRRLMAARPAALARKRSAAVARPVRTVVLACDRALAQALTRHLSQALIRLTTGAMDLVSSPVEVGGQMPPAVRAADHVLLALDGRDAHLSASLTWVYALVKHWHAAGSAPGLAGQLAQQAGHPEQRCEHNRLPGCVQNPAYKARLVLCGVQSPLQAQRALANLSAMARRYLGCGLPVAGNWRPGADAAAQDLAELAAAMLQWPLGTTGHRS